MGSLFTLIILAALPIALSCLWLIIRKYRFSLIWFLCALLAGILSVLIAFIMQWIIPSINGETRAALFTNIILRTAIPEETSKFLMMFLLIALSKKWNRLNPIEEKQDGAAAGFIVALGFSLFETAGYSVSNLQLTFLRAITASPIHAACGIRAGMSAISFRNHQTAFGLWNIFLAVIIHTVYNFIILNSETPLIFLMLIVTVSTLSSLMHIKQTSE
jgi:RsiW-degrading membrane proteinase PrsW (M82 family)